jgi:hypothetical protein
MILMHYSITHLYNFTSYIVIKAFTDIYTNWSNVKGWAREDGGESRDKERTEGGKE